MENTLYVEKDLDRKVMGFLVSNETEMAEKLFLFGFELQLQMFNIIP